MKVKDRYILRDRFIGGASTASEATLSSCPLRFAVYVGGYVQSIPEAVAMW